VRRAGRAEADDLVIHLAASVVDPADGERVPGPSEVEGITDAELVGVGRGDVAVMEEGAHLAGPAGSEVPAEAEPQPGVEIESPVLRIGAGGLDDRGDLEGRLLGE
jgi:hypothetical protein